MCSSKQGLDEGHISHSILSEGEKYRLDDFKSKETKKTQPTKQQKNSKIKQTTPTKQKTMRYRKQLNKKNAL